MDQSDWFARHLAFTQAGHTFAPSDVDRFIWLAMRGVKTVRKSGEKGYTAYNMPSAFDIETTSSYNEAGEKIAWMYGWQLGVNGLVMIGRTWGELNDVLATICSTLGTDEALRWVIYDQFLGFEFQFLRLRYGWKEVFALKNRTPVMALTDTGIMFRDSLTLTGKSLAAIGDGLQKYHVKKMVGDLDYDKIRHSDTPLTDKEIGYMVNDVLVVMAEIQERMEREGSIIKIPNTKTGYVRRLCRNRCLYGKDGGRHDDYNAYRSYKKLMDQLTLTPNEFRQAQRCYSGGYTHTSAMSSRTIVHWLESLDFTSSYPAIMVGCTFPYSGGRMVSVTSDEQLEEYLRNYHCMMDVKFMDIDETFLPEHYIQKSKCMYLSEDAMIDNGRVVSAHELIISATELDLEIIRATYTAKSMTVFNLRIYQKGYLPEPYIQTVLDLYSDKTKLKGQHSEDGSIELQYSLAKEYINSLYGMMATSPIRPEYKCEDGEWQPATDPEIDKAIEKYNNDKTRFTSFLWGVWVCAWGRYNLWTGGILPCGSDYHYADTDSIKVTRYEDHRDAFDHYNASVDDRMRAAAEARGFDFEATRPLDIKGKPHPLGHWDDEGKIARFKSLGAKRYICEYPDGSMQLTVAGLGKGPAIKYLLDKHKGHHGAVLAEFDHHMVVPPEHTGKLTHTYLDYPQHGTVTDYLGNVGRYDELSSLHLEASDYSLSLADDYIAFLMGMEDEVMPE